MIIFDNTLWPQFVSKPNETIPLAPFCSFGGTNQLHSALHYERQKNTCESIGGAGGTSVATPWKKMRHFPRLYCS